MDDLKDWLSRGAGEEGYYHPGDEFGFAHVTIENIPSSEKGDDFQIQVSINVDCSLIMQHASSMKDPEGWNIKIHAAGKESLFIKSFFQDLSRSTASCALDALIGSLKDLLES